MIDNDLSLDDLNHTMLASCLPDSAVTSIRDRSMLRRLVISAGSALLLAAPSVASAQSCRNMAGNIVLNCSFELGIVKNGADYPNATVSNWTSLGNASSGTFERWTNSFNGFASKDGSSHLELQVNSPTAIQQILGTTSGTQYTLSFWAANRPRGVNGYSQIDVYLNNVLLTSTGRIAPTYQWFNFTQTFVATGPSSTIKFSSMGNQNSHGDFLDNVSVVGTSTVPEPSSFVLTGLGAGLVGFMVRRKRSA